MPRTAPPNDRQMREDMLEDGMQHLRDAQGCLGTVAQLTEDLHLDHAPEWKAISDDLEAILTRANKLVK